MKMTPTDALIHQVRTKPREPAFFFRGETWTYQRLAAVAEHLACGLIKRGVKSGDRVALHMMNRPEMIVAYYACFQIGAIVAPLRTAFKPAELAPLLQRLKPALYIGEANLYENVAPIETSILASDKRVIVGEAVESWGCQPWATLFFRRHR
jgi:acyl-CoA synthetase (AMP-forming)/AMP-acid ligase II